jgi:hypothetical protein
VLVSAATAGIALADSVTGSAAPEEVAAPDPTPVPGSESVESRTADPAGGPPWAVRVYKLASGDSCADFGREVDGRLGLIDGAGRFHVRRSADAGGNCGDPDAATGLLLAATFYPDDPTTDEFEPPRTIIHGIAGVRVRQIEVRWPDRSEPVELSPRRGFVAVYDGQVTDLLVTVTYRDGTVNTFNLKLHG